jgi:hypothetical protein
MKTGLLSIFTLSLWASLPAWADDTPAPDTNSGETSGVTALCNTYADEDSVTSTARDAYIQDCLKRMTDLSDGVGEDVPLVSDGTDESVAAPSTEQLKFDPEQAIEDEITTSPDPQAEQLDAEKK